MPGHLARQIAKVCAFFLINCLCSRSSLENTFN